MGRTCPTHHGQRDRKPGFPVFTWGCAPTGLAALRQLLGCVIRCKFGNGTTCAGPAPHHRVRRRTRAGVLTYGRCVVCHHRTSHRRGGRWIHDVCAEGPCPLCAPHAFARHTSARRWEVR